MGRIFLMAMAVIVSIAASGLVFVVAAALDPILQLFAIKVVLTDVWTFLKALFTLTPFEDGLLGTPTALIYLFIIPPLITALLGEVLGWRSFIGYGVCNAGLAAVAVYLLPEALRPITVFNAWIGGEMALVGLVGGLTYWLLAGRSFSG